MDEYLQIYLIKNPIMGGYGIRLWVIFFVCCLGDVQVLLWDSKETWLACNKLWKQWNVFGCILCPSDPCWRQKESLVTLIPMPKTPQVDNICSYALKNTRS